ncbi:GAF domain-containing protein, partial [Candidatus Gracilibacteria bacterium]|nr:GAF domain-containing protein [Candidatus Gracilibacteria bacterium]
MPLRSGDEVLGILNVATTQWGRIAPPELQLLSAAGFLLGTAIARAPPLRARQGAPRARAA